VTLDHIAAMVRAGDDVRVVENTTRADLTTATLAQIIFEEEKKQRSFLPLGAMRNIIQNGSEWFAEAQRRVQSILPGKRKDGEDGVDGEPPPDPDAHAGETEDAAAKRRSLASLREWVDTSKSRLDEWQRQVDGKVRGAIEGIQQSINPWAHINKDVKALADRIDELETKLRELEHEQK
jgi:polyhydroxyalkanoate synthesis regulator phasin